MKKFSICLFLAIRACCCAQNTYIDPTVTAAMILYSENLKSRQNKTIDEQSKLQQAQTLVASQMAVANSIQNKLLKGLQEVSGTLKNGIRSWIFTTRSIAVSNIREILSSSLKTNLSMRYSERRLHRKRISRRLN